jgi:DNA sulfur modification protein DndE
MSLEHVRLSQQAKEQLSRLKRWTAIDNWNVLCRWALGVSLREPSPPPSVKIVTDSSVEMTWKVFAGKYSDTYLALLKQRCDIDGLPTDDDTVAQQFKLHLHRGIAYLAADKRLRSITHLVQQALRGQATR